MSLLALEVTDAISDLNLRLTSTLDEHFFFMELGKFIKENSKNNICLIRQVLENDSVLIVKNGECITEDDSISNVSLHVIRSKRAYFSNCVSRDPLFTREAKEGVTAELCVPVICDGVIICTLHLQNTNQSNEFSRDDITEILNFLNQIKRPLMNIKMYLQAKTLNDVLQKRIEEKERELDQRTKGIQLADAYKIEEKEVIGKSEILAKILKLADKIALTDTHIMIEGEAGTGKELIARRIHCRGSRAQSVFIVLDCSALNREQLESEIFGDEQIVGGSRKNKIGILEQANGGTLFIENISFLTPAMQLKLVQFLKDGVASKQGGQSLYKSNVRVIAASSKSLHLEVELHKFREDLYYALNTMTIKLPALREHREDIELLANYFLNLGKIIDKQKSLSPEALRSMLDYTWPGNVRELQNVMERAFILADGKIIEKNHLADSVTVAPLVEQEKEEEKIVFSEMTLEELEKRHIVFTLGHLGGNKTKTAKSLGITVKTLYNKLHSYGMIAAQEISH